jgi:hypothetical protein
MDQAGVGGGAKQSWSMEKPFHCVAIIECTNPEHRHSLKVICEDGTPTPLLNRARLLSGALVAMTSNGSEKRLETLSGYGFDCVDQRASPEELEIPVEWLGDGDAQNIRI